MARRQSGFSDLMEFASTLPWKVGCTVAAVSFLVFHFTAVATSSPPAVKTLGELGLAVDHQFLHLAASFLQFIFPAGFLFGATASFLKGAQRRTLFAQASAAPRATVDRLNWQEFERLVGESFRRRGYQVDERGGSTPDGGVDLVVIKARQRYLVQCKHWRTQQVGVGVVRELNGVVSAEAASGGFVVTGGQFTREAQEFSRKTKIELIDGKALEERIGAIIATRSIDSPEPVIEAPACPRCGTGMVRRVAKQGKHVGRDFWGCGQYPKCSEIVQISCE
jgi:restriction system protein